jgi:hypothetical protein
MSLVKGNAGSDRKANRSGTTPGSASPPRPDGAQNKCQGGTITAHLHLHIDAKMLPSACLAICADCDKVSFLSVSCAEADQDRAT